LATHTPKPLDDTSKEIGQLIAARVRDASTMQLGIGAVPDAVLASLTDHRDLRIWTEMFSDGVLELDRRGCLDNDIPLTASFLFGSQDLYDWVHLNKRVRMLRTEKTNDPGQIARQARMTSVNGALQVDLFDQANASRVKGEIYSGIGGSTDFIVGALHSRGGQSFMALHSWHPKANVSTVVPHLKDPVTSMQHSYGLAQCFGRSQRTQALNLIEHAAHPDARDELREAAGEMGLL
jgi:acyl-CoA hydrolase